MFTSFLSWIGSLASSTGSKACWVWFMDEPKMPKSLIK